MFRRHRFQPRVGGGDLRESVVPSFGRDVVPLDLLFLRPSEDCVRCELRAVIGYNRQFSYDTTAGDRGVRDRCQAFARRLIDDIEHTEALAAGELIIDKIQQPTSIGLRFEEDRRTVPTARRLAVNRYRR